MNLHLKRTVTSITFLRFSSFLSIAVVTGTALAAPPARAADSPWNQRVYRVSQAQPASWNELASALRSAQLIDLGEKHLTSAVQLAQARVITETFASEAPGAFVLGWEFLNFKDQPRTAGLFAQFRAGALTASQFLAQALGDAGYESYAPIIEAAKQLEADLYGLNLSREDKAPVVESGLAALAPGLLPPGYEGGGANYFERFVAAMDGHEGDPALIRNYFDAQCLVDDELAYHLLQAPSQGARVMVNGSFHSDYFDGAVHRLRVRAPTQSLVSVRFFDASDYAEAALLPLLNDPKYGPVADFVVFVNEPTP